MLFEDSLFHPVAQVIDLGDRPLAAHLMEQDLVLWRDSTGRVHAAADRCPHRGAALSLGRVHHGPNGDTLECAYHGWRFDGTGRCIAVPAVPHFIPPPEHRACAYSALTAYGLVWVALRADLADVGSERAAVAAGLLPAFAAEQDAQLRKVNFGPYDVDTSAPRLIENFLDMSHFGFVHEGWLGSREHTAMADYRVDTTPTGFLASECTAWQPQSSVHATGGSMVEYTYEVNAPYACVLTKAPEASAVAVQGFRESIAMFVCPLGAENSRVWIRMAMNDFESPDSRLQEFQDTIFGQDRAVLESQRPRCLPITPQAPVTELHSAADRASAAYRRYLRERGVTYGVC